MILLYNLLQIALSPLIVVALFLGLLKKKNRKKFPQRLGINLPKQEKNRDTIWIHALSVGEINSSLPLIRSLKENFGDHRIVVSASTVAGIKRAEEILHSHADHIIGAPFDLLPVVVYYLYRIKPSIYIQVETDFWPNILLGLKLTNIPRILVNGRISTKSMESYRRFSFFFQPLFKAYSCLSMQTHSDIVALQQLGVPKAQTAYLGNLKFTHKIGRPKLTIPDFYQKVCADAQVIVAGSTHPGEEDILFDAFATIQQSIPNALLFVAPRNIERGAEIAALAQGRGLTPSCRSHNNHENADVHIIDTIGELLQFYTLADICLVGGSLIDFGGHNPLEPARLAKPILFGPYMGSFKEITPPLIDTGAAIQVQPEELSTALQSLLLNQDRRTEMAKAAHHFVYNQQKGILDAHIDKIRQLLNG